mmetsp:Transcript_98146/g.262095  ORF Transcript_98146/g.262095 Transcript_98146/m.262095 type:complete len:215 (+) Transcript_98146:776-1420(+)
MMDSPLDLPGAPRMRRELRHCDQSSISASSCRQTSAEAKLPSKPGRQKIFAPTQDHTFQTGQRGTCWSLPSPSSPLPTRQSPDRSALLRRPHPGHPNANLGLGRLGHRAEPRRLTAAIPRPLLRRRGDGSRGRGRNHKANTCTSGLRWQAPCRIDRRYCSPPPAPSRKAPGHGGPGSSQPAQRQTQGRSCHPHRLGTKSTLGDCCPTSPSPTRP